MNYKSLLFFLLTIISFNIFANDTLLGKDFDRRIGELMSKGDIPGLSLVIVKGDQTMVKGFGYADLQTNTKVTPQTFFEIGSCTKAFTALAALKLQKEGLLNLNDPVTKYLPWLQMRYKDREFPITLDQFLHHTSGVPFKSISHIPADTSSRALENTVRTLVGQELAHVPGTVYEYATINYDVIGLVIDKVSGMSYERYMVENIFQPLGLKNTFFGKEQNGTLAT